MRPLLRTVGADQLDIEILAKLGQTLSVGIALTNMKKRMAAAVKGRWLITRSGHIIESRLSFFTSRPGGIVDEHQEAAFVGGSRRFEPAHQGDDEVDKLAVCVCHRETIDHRRKVSTETWML